MAKKKKVNPIFIILIVIAFFYFAGDKGYLGSVTPGAESLVGYTGDSTGSWSFYNESMYAQSFKIDESVTLTDASIKISTLAGEPADVQLAIRSSLEGNDLSVGYYSETTPQYLLRVIDVPMSQIALQPGTYYLIVMGTTGKPQMKFSLSNVYSNGMMHATGNGGASWVYYNNWDIYFEIWGIPSSGECTENWQCTAWSDCVDNAQTRACTDSNNCGTTNNKPIESQSCTSQGYCGGPPAECNQGTFYPNIATQSECESYGCTWNLGTPQDCASLRTQLGLDITAWISGSLSRSALGQSIQAWVDC